MLCFRKLAREVVCLVHILLLSDSLEKWIFHSLLTNSGGRPMPRIYA
jgi:hypothetical protein